LFWTQNCLDQIKVITRAHPCHHFHILLKTGLWIPDLRWTAWRRCTRGRRCKPASRRWCAAGVDLMKQCRPKYTDKH
jgi:hypothetical protein